MILLTFCLIDQLLVSTEFDKRAPTEIIILNINFFIVHLLYTQVKGLSIIQLKDG